MIRTKNFFRTFIFLAGVALFSFTDPTPQDNPEIINAIKTGNASMLAKNFNNSIDLLIPGNEGTYSKAQAEIIISNFFKANPPKSFAVKQEGTSSDSSKYTIGTYSSSNNKNFRTYYLTKKIGASQLIQLLQFELN